MTSHGACAVTRSKTASRSSVATFHWYLSRLDGRGVDELPVHDLEPVLEEVPQPRLDPSPGQSLRTEYDRGHPLPERSQIVVRDTGQIGISV
jgi:hypothetical protein